MMSDFINNFHFLRPIWLLGLFALPLLFYVSTIIKSKSNAWNTQIDPKLLKHLTQNSAIAAPKSKRHWLITCILILCLIAISGPTWTQTPKPLSQVSDDVIVILDLSISMLATDQQPNRLTRAKQKIIDFLDHRSEGYTALIVYSGDSHTVTPLTDDVNTIKLNLNSLDPFIMPVIGSRLDLAVIQANRLFSDVNVSKGRILVVSDDVTDAQIETIKDTLSSTMHSLSVIAVGTEEGGPIEIPGRGYFKDKGVTVIPKTDFSKLSKLANENRGLMHPLSLTDRDLELFASTKSVNTEHRNIQDTNFDTWEDMGYVLLILIVPLTLVAYRQNKLTLLSVVLLVILDTQKPVYAFSWDDLWQTKDQQGQALLKNKKFKDAKQAFNSEEHRAFSAYQNGDYEDASNLYGEAAKNTTNTSNELLFNQATSLAKSGKLDEALTLFDQILKNEPSNVNAQHNKNIVKQLLDQQSQNQQSDQEDQQNNQNSENQNGQNQNEQKQNSQASGNNEQQQSQSEQNSAQSDNSNDSKNEKNTENASNSRSESNDASREKSLSQLNNEDSEANTKDHENEQRTADSEDSGDEQSAKTQDLTQQEFRAVEGEQTNPDSSEGATSYAEELSQEEQQSIEQWMRRVPDDPSGLLRRKFEQQALDRQRRGLSNIDNSEGPLW